MSKEKEKIDISALKAEDFIKEFPEMVQSLDSARGGSDKVKPVEISFDELVKETWGLSQDEVLLKAGINTKVDTMENIFSMPDSSVRWVIPEIIRTAIVVGMRQAPFYPNLISGDQPIQGLQATMPWINMSDAAPSKLNEAETIPLGTISYDQKTVNLFKIGKGIKLTDEVRSYVSLDVMSIFLRDFGIQLGYAMDTLAMDTLINGNKLDGSEAVSVVGTASGNSIVYRDLLKVWIRASRMGRNFNTMVGDEDIALDILDLPEFKDRHYGETLATLNIKSPVPNSADYYIHPGVPANSTLLVDKRAAMIKLTAKNLTLESERIASNGTDAIYANLTTGFSKMFQDASILIDKSKQFSTYGFPTFMNIDPYLQVGLQ